MTGEQKHYRLETQFSIVETDEHGRWISNNRFELRDNFQLPDLPLPTLLEIMGKLHSAFTGITDVINSQQ